MVLALTLTLTRVKEFEKKVTLPYTSQSICNNYSVKLHLLYSSDHQKRFVSEQFFQETKSRDATDVDRLYIDTNSRRDIYLSRGDFSIVVSLFHC